MTVLPQRAVTAPGRDSLAAAGFEPVKQVLDRDELAAVRAGLDGLHRHLRDRNASTEDVVLEAGGDGGWAAWQRGKRPLPGVIRSISPLHHYLPLIEDLAAVVWERAVAPRTGGSLTLANTFLWAKPANIGSEKPWHQDMAFAPPGFTDRFDRVVTLWVAVTAATRANGCLEFVPGSHRRGSYPHVGDAERTDAEPRRPDAVEPHVDLAATGLDADPVAVSLRPGDGVLFDGFLLHRSAANRSPQARTAVSFVYALAGGTPTANVSGPR